MRRKPQTMGGRRLLGDLCLRWSDVVGRGEVEQPTGPPLLFGQNCVLVSVRDE